MDTQKVKFFDEQRCCKLFYTRIRWPHFAGSGNGGSAKQTQCSRGSNQSTILFGGLFRYVIAIVYNNYFTVFNNREGAKCAAATYGSAESPGVVSQVKE